ncbi:YwmB family TATA-box binding protein [Metabacillus idriensis]|uniref:YwmB family TATA-box binding protein n=1 Tax=Metabacillus idriensis TaxID=324768 RepID=UPI0017487037|nr:YwmB family TATA-box binding protein [Metabacillus idriensis]
MKQVFTIIVIIFSIFIFNQNSDVSGKLKDDALNDLHQMALNHDIKVENWNMYTKESENNLDIQSVKKEINQVKKKGSIYDWETELDEHHMTLTGTYKNSNRNEKVIVGVVPSGNSYNLSFTHSVKGNGKDIMAQVELVLIPFQYDQDNQYVTISGETARPIELNRLKEKLLNDSGAKEIEALKEKNFYSISGYTSKWDNGIAAINDQLMNFQLGLRKKDNGIIHITMGTPIITSEY